jgi:hypothetical protein
MELDEEDKEKNKGLERKLEQEDETEESGKAEGDEQESEKSGFFSNAWSKVKSVGSFVAKKGKKTAGFLTGSHDSVDEMSDDEFEEHLYSLDTEEDPGYSKRYRELVKELSTMPSLMAFSQKAEPDDVKEATKDSEKEEKDSGAKAEGGKDGKASKAESKKTEEGDSKAASKESEDTSEEKTEETEKEKSTPEKKATDQAKVVDAVEKKVEEQAKEEIDKKDEEKKSEEGSSATETKAAETTEGAKAEAKETKADSTGGTDTASKEASSSKTEAAESKEKAADTTEKKSEDSDKTSGDKGETEESKEDEETKEKDAEEVAETAEGEEEKTESKSKKAAKKVKEVAKKLLNAKDDAVDTVKAGTGIYNNVERSKRLEKMIASKEAGSKDARALQYMKDKSEKDAKTGGFDVAKGLVDTAAKLATSFGNTKIGEYAGKIAGLINMGLAFGKEKLAQRLDKKSVKNGMKNLIGGTDAYKKLKEKYKLKAPDMRRAIRTAAKATSGKALVDADKDKLVEDYSKNGDVDGEAAIMAGGLKSSKLSDAMGAGKDEKEQTKDEAKDELKNVAKDSKDALIDLIGKKDEWQTD